MEKKVFCTNCAHFERRPFFFKPWRCAKMLVKKWKNPPKKPTACDKYEPKEND